MWWACCSYVFFSYLSHLSWVAGQSPCSFPPSVFLSNQRSESIDFSLWLCTSVPRHHFVVTGGRLCQAFKNGVTVAVLMYAKSENFTKLWRKRRRGTQKKMYSLVKTTFHSPHWIPPVPPATSRKAIALYVYVNSHLIIIYYTVLCYYSKGYL